MNNKRNFSLPRRSNVSSIVNSTHKNSKNSSSVETSIISNITNVSQRRSRKSLLGTRKVTRESILLFPSENLFSIHEESKSQKELEIPDSEDKSHEQKEKIALPIQGISSNGNDVSQSVTGQDSLMHCTITEFSEQTSVSPLRKRLNVLFSPNDDSFIAHETMMNDESMLATTLLPQNESILARTLVFSDESRDSDIITISNLKPADLIPSENVGKTSETISTALPKETDDILSEQTVGNILCEQKDDLTRFLKLLDSIIERNSQTVVAYGKQIEELQLKVHQCNQENKEIRNMKRVMMNACDKRKEMNKENVEPCECLPQNLPKKLNCENVPKTGTPINSSNESILHEMKGTIKCLKTPRLAIASRPSTTILTPHSMSYSINDEWKKLLE